MSTSDERAEATAAEAAIPREDENAEEEDGASNGTFRKRLDPAKVTMRDLIYMNPKKSTMSANQGQAGSGRLQLQRSVASVPALPASSHQQRPEASQDAPPSPSHAAASAGPQIKIVNGEIVVDETSLVQQATAAAPPTALVPIEASKPVTYSSFSRRQVSAAWTALETKKFYRALEMCGMNFDLMLRAFPGRTHRQLKNKYLREHRANPQKVTSAVELRAPLDVNFLAMNDTASAPPAKAPSVSGTEPRNTAASHHGTSSSSRRAGAKSTAATVTAATTPVKHIGGAEADRDDSSPDARSKPPHARQSTSATPATQPSGRGRKKTARQPRTSKRKATSDPVPTASTSADQNPPSAEKPSSKRRKTSGSVADKSSPPKSAKKAASRATSATAAKKQTNTKSATKRAQTAAVDKAPSHASTSQPATVVDQPSPPKSSKSPSKAKPKPRPQPKPKAKNKPNTGAARKTKGKAGSSSNLVDDTAAASQVSNSVQTALQADASAPGARGKAKSKGASESPKSKRQPKKSAAANGAPKKSNASSHQAELQSEPTQQRTKKSTTSPAEGDGKAEAKSSSKAQPTKPQKRRKPKAKPKVKA